MQQITIVCGADNNFSMPLAVTLFSAISNLRKGELPEIFVLDGGIKPENKKRINRCLNRSNRKFVLNWISFDIRALSDLNETANISRAAYLRVLIPDLLPQVHKKAIYLDCDMIVEADLMLLWEKEFTNEAAMGVQDFSSPFISTTSAIPDYETLQLSAETPYCNSGLLVMNLPYWRRNSLKTTVFDYLRKNERALDQDGINIAVRGNWKLLDPRWNVTLSSLGIYGERLSMTQTEIEVRREEIRRHPYIIHFTSRHKPWHSGTGNKEALTSFYYDQKFINRYFDYLERSGWYNYPYFWCWKTYRKLVLFFEFKLPRRWSHIRPGKNIEGLPA